MTEELEPDDLLVLRTYKQAKKDRHADIDIGVKDGVLIRLHPTSKVDIRAELDRIRRLREVGARPPAP